MRFLGYTLANEAETPTEPPRPELYEEMGKFVEQAVKAGVIVATGGISPTSEGRKITLKAGEFNIVDGPFAEAKEIVGGFFLLDCATREEAVAIASECPATEWATVEVREIGPCWEGNG